MGDRAVLMTYFNSAWKNAQHTQISFHVKKITSTATIITLETNTQPWCFLCSELVSGRTYEQRHNKICPRRRSTDVVLLPLRTPIPVSAEKLVDLTGNVSIFPSL